MFQSYQPNADYEFKFGKNQIVGRPPLFRLFPGVFLNYPDNGKPNCFFPVKAFIASYDIPLKDIVVNFEGMARQTYKGIQDIINENMDDLPFSDDETRVYSSLVSMSV